MVLTERYVMLKTDNLYYGGMNMKKFDVKSIALGFIIGTVGITSVFASDGIKSATLSNAKVTLDEVSVPLKNSLIEIVKDDEKGARLYMPVRELLEYLGYIVNWDGTNDTVNLVSNNGSSHEVIGDIVSDGNIVINLSNKNDYNISESGSFQAENNQILTLDITSNIKGGTVDLFLFDPNGKEQRITIGSANTTKEITLIKGVWQYNCTGMFKDGGNIKIAGTIK